jgi:predicted phage-related endonuclease
LARWDVAVLIAGNDFRSYRVDRNEERELELLEAGLRFWTDHILPDHPPPVDGSDASRRYLQSLMPSRPRIVPAPVEAERLGRRLLELRATSKQADAERSLLENQLCELLTAAAADGFAGDWGRFTWRQERGRVAWKNVAEDLGCSDIIVEKHRGASCRVARLTGVGQ